MDGKARVKRQVASGVRDRVLLLDRWRTLHGFDAVVSLTPKVETRLRAGDQPQINLRLQYTASDVSMELSIPRDYPKGVIEVSLKDLQDSGDGAEVRKRKCGVIYEYLQTYLTKAAEEAGMRDDEGFSLETVDDSMAGLQVIEKFNQAVSHLSIAGDISLNGMGEIQRSIFQFGGIHEAVDGLGTKSSGSDEGEEKEKEDAEAESGNTQEREEEEPLPLDTYKCKRCRHRLFLSSDLEVHEYVRPSPVGCTSLFLSEDCASRGFGAKAGADLALLDDTGTSQTGNSGKVACAKCGTRVGSWSWLGMPCSCKAWICPGFQITASKVDKS